MLLRRFAVADDIGARQLEPGVGAPQRITDTLEQLAGRDIVVPRIVLAAELASRIAAAQQRVGFAGRIAAATVQRRRAFITLLRVLEPFETPLEIGKLLENTAGGNKITGLLAEPEGVVERFARAFDVILGRQALRFEEQEQYRVLRCSQLLFARIRTVL